MKLLVNEEVALPVNRQLMEGASGEA